MSDHTRDFVKRSPIVLQGSILQCPHCGDTNLHYEKVYIYSRWYESSNYDILKIDTDCHCVTKRTQNINPENCLVGSPSKHHDGIRIFFSCDSCDASIHMTIADNAGCTQLAMEHIEHGRFSLVEWP